MFYACRRGVSIGFKPLFFDDELFFFEPKMSRMCPVKAIKKPKILIFNILGFVVPLGLEPKSMLYKK